MSDFSYIQRQEKLEKLKSPDSPIYDLCVVGGGITGCGIARDAALKGLNVLLVERKDLAWGTSSRSSKLVHGGVRYLENFEIGLVFESTQERALLWKNAPQLCHPIPFLFPAYKSSKVPLWKLNLGLWLYDILATFRVPSRHRKYSKKTTQEKEPLLLDEELSGSIFYWDGATNDARLTLANAIDAQQLGATVLPRVSLENIQWNSNVGDDKKNYHTIELKDQLTDSTVNAKCRSLVVAGGPWCDEILSTIGKTRKSKLLATTRGSHLVVKKEKLYVQHAIVLNHPKDDRVLFAIPWGQFTVLGTTDIFDESSPDHTHMTSEEVDYLIDAAAGYFPKAPLTRDDVVSVWSGLRPLIRPDEEASASEVSREHHLEWFNEGLVVIAGGKLTTYRNMAAECVDTLLRKSSAWKEPIEAPKSQESTKHRSLPILAFPAEDRHGPIGRSEAAKLSASDILGVCKNQMLLKLEDFMVRRTDLYYKEESNGLNMLDELKVPLCEAMQWSEEIWAKEVQDYRNFVTEQNSWKQV